MGSCTFFCLFTVPVALQQGIPFILAMIVKGCATLSVEDTSKVMPALLFLIERIVIPVGLMSGIVYDRPSLNTIL